MATAIAFFVIALPRSPHDHNNDTAKSVIADQISPKPGRKSACLSSSHQRDP
jgi:hypothetical protein